SLPDRFVLFVGTLEPRKNLRGLVEARRRMADPLPLVVAGASGWGDSGVATDTPGVHFLGFVSAEDLGGLYAAADVLCYPSLREGYGLPVLEAMVQGTPVVTSRGTATEEAAGGAAVLVDPTDPDDIARGLEEAVGRRDDLSRAGRARAAERTWEGVAEATVAAYRDVVR
ncbi:MAG: glycosyltransferase, partial [Ilumatobacteraceae bacterium]